MHVIFALFRRNLKIRGNWGPRGILCTRGEKEHTSKRVSVIVRDNVISKAQCATHSRFLMLVYVRLFEFGNVRIIICWLLVEKQITDELLKSASKYARLDNKKRPWERSFFVGA